MRVRRPGSLGAEHLLPEGQLYALKRSFGAIEDGREPRRITGVLDRLQLPNLSLRHETEAMAAPVLRSSATNVPTHPKRMNPMLIGALEFTQSVAWKAKRALRMSHADKNRDHGVPLTRASRKHRPSPASRNKRTHSSSGSAADAHRLGITSARRVHGETAALGWR